MTNENCLRLAELRKKAPIAEAKRVSLSALSCFCNKSNHFCNENRCSLLSKAIFKTFLCWNLDQDK